MKWSLTIVALIVRIDVRVLEERYHDFEATAVCDCMKWSLTALVLLVRVNVRELEKCSHSF